MIYRGEPVDTILLTSYLFCIAGKIWAAEQIVQKNVDHQEPAENLHLNVESAERVEIRENLFADLFHLSEYSVDTHGVTKCYY